MLLQSFLRDWYRINYSPQVKPNAENMMEIGAEFEIELMKVFIGHHFRIVESVKSADRDFHEELENEICEPSY